LAVILQMILDGHGIDETWRALTAKTAAPLVALFRKYGEQYEIDWLLMAAQGYQESQLDQTRRSSAGAIGVMQLTTATGNQMGVGAIGELEANIHAGIKYVRFMVDNYSMAIRL
jgi:membrane-bound lytic murein transglycosylase MltF